MPAADKDNSAAPVKVYNETREVKDVNERIEPPPCGFEYIFVPDFTKGESLPDLCGSTLAPIVDVFLEAAPKCKYVSVCDLKAQRLKNLCRPLLFIARRKPGLVEKQNHIW